MDPNKSNHVLPIIIKAEEFVAATDFILQEGVIITPEQISALQDGIDYCCEILASISGASLERPTDRTIQLTPGFEGEEFVTLQSFQIALLELPYVGNKLSINIIGKLVQLLHAASELISEFYTHPLPPLNPLPQHE